MDKVFNILLKLVRNAIKFTDRGVVYFGCKNKGNGYVFFVIDTGIGIPLEKQPILFDKFVQVNIEDKEAREGIGLGLAIVKSSIDLLGGKIKFK